MVPNHATQTDPYLHEAKGASTAVAGTVLTATGSGTATFQAPAIGGSGSVVKTTSSLVNSLITGTTLIPLDDTIPQITEGTEFITISYTPSAIGNRIRVTANTYGAYSVAAKVTAALFEGTTANALAATAETVAASNDVVQHTLSYEGTVSSLTALTYRLRIGGSTAGTYTLNGAAGARLFGGIGYSSLVVTEIKA